MLSRQQKRTQMQKEAAVIGQGCQMHGVCAFLALSKALAGRAEAQKLHSTRRTLSFHSLASKTVHSRLFSSTYYYLNCHGIQCPTGRAQRSLSEQLHSNRILDSSWNHFLVSEMAFICEDQSIGWLDAFNGAPMVKNDIATATIKEPAVEGKVRCCCWANHPRLLYIIEGRSFKDSFSQTSSYGLAYAY